MYVSALAISFCMSVFIVGEDVHVISLNITGPEYKSISLHVVLDFR